MAKVSFSKLALKPVVGVATFEENEQTIEVKQYLPIEEKMELITRVLNYTVDSKGYYNAGLLDMNLTLEIIFTYTNISFTEKQKESREKLFDTIISSGLWVDVCACLPTSELKWINRITAEQIDKIYGYRNSVMGILENVIADYRNVEMNANDIKEAVGDESLDFLKDVLTKLG